MDAVGVVLAMLGGGFVTQAIALAKRRRSPAWFLFGALAWPVAMPIVTAIPPPAQLP